MRKILAYLLGLILVIGTLTVQAENIDLSKMSSKELQELQEAISLEIKKNHTLSADDRSQVLETVKKETETLFRRRGIKISWPWDDYNYMKDWDLYTFASHIDYTDENNIKQKPGIYAKVKKTGDEYVLSLLKVGEKVMLGTDETENGQK